MDTNQETEDTKQEPPVKLEVMNIKPSTDHWRNSFQGLLHSILFQPVIDETSKLIVLKSALTYLKNNGYNDEEIKAMKHEMLGMINTFKFKKLPV